MSEVCSEQSGEEDSDNNESDHDDDDDDDDDDNDNEWNHENAPEIPEEFLKKFKENNRV